MPSYPVIKSAAYCLAHVPDLVRYGSKPRRELARQPELATKLAHRLRSYDEAVRYPANQTFIGNLTPETLAAMPRPWFRPAADAGATTPPAQGPFGEIVDQETFYGLLRRADVLQPPLFVTDDKHRQRLAARLAAHPLLPGLNTDSTQLPTSPSLAPPPSSALPLLLGDELYGYFLGDQRAEGHDDENLAAHHLLENLCTKASGSLALNWLLHRAGIEPEQIDFVISCGEEACGDRYQRGGGGMAKAMAELCGCANASGLDIKNFCAAPASAIIMAAALIQAGVHQRIAVVGGGSLAKLGMKFQAFLDHGMPILDDSLAAMAFLVTTDDAKSPIIRLDPGAVGKVPIAASTSDEAVFRHYLLAPLAALGLKLTDIDRFAPELQNPEITEFAGSGDVTKKNYRKIAAMAVLAGQLGKEEMEAWISRVGMVGFAPTQGHIPSAVPYLGHAMAAMEHGEIKRAMFLARASIFLNRCTSLLDGVSFIVEQNPGSARQDENKRNSREE